MAKSNSRKSPEIRIVVDTNAIWNSNEHYLVKKEIAELARETQTHQDVQFRWYLPDVVRAEREFQMRSKAREILPALTRLERLIGHQLGFTSDTLDKRIRENISQQIGDLSFDVPPFDCTAVDWSAVIAAAINRSAPFEAGETEKGFRDAVILETFAQVVSDAPSSARDCRVVLLTGDGLLAQAASLRFIDRKNVRVLKSIDELKGLVNTLVSQVTEEFVRELQPKAERLFFDPKDEHLLLSTLQVAAEIERACAAELHEVPDGATFRRNNRSLAIGATRFVRKDRQRVYWATRITIDAAAFKYDINPDFFRGAVTHTTDPLWWASAKSWADVGTPVGSVDRPKTMAELKIRLKDLLIANERLASTRPSPAADTLERQVAKGTTAVDVEWSVSVSTRGRLTGARFEKVQFIETTWT